MTLPLTPIRFLYRAADLFARRVGIVCGDKQFTYGQFAERCERLAGQLLALGVEPGDRVAYISFNTHLLLEGYYGVVMAGGIVMPLNVRLTPGEITGILNHSGARIVFYEAEFAGMVRSLECPAVAHWIQLDQFALDAPPARCDWTKIDENQVAELFYTSGSTGTPKGVSLTHRTLYLHAMSLATTFDDPKTKVDLHTIPLFHANGWGMPQACAMMGTKQVMVRRFDPAAVLALIAEHKATDMCLVPTMANALLNCPQLGQFDTSSLRHIMLGGAASSPELIARLEAAFVCEAAAGYGLTETAPVLSKAGPKPGVVFADEADRQRRQAMTGWPLPGVEIRVVDPQGNDVPRDASSIGEIITRSDHVMAGYFKEPAATAAVMEGDWFHTGDMAVWDAEGYVLIVDRKKEIIISGGENISSIEVERAIAAHPAVLECAVVAAPDEKWGEVPVAVVVRKPGAELGQEELLAFLGARLGRFKLPRIIEFRAEALPKTGTGKIRKLELKEAFWAGKVKRVQG
ncbi:MAG: long-chain-fatty-acid--CoA ligase [Acidobacteriota bacterium]